jgi:hypothetical protein
MPGEKKHQPPAGKRFRGIFLELFDQAQHPTMRDLFHDEAARQEFDTFCKKPRLFVTFSNLHEKEWVKVTGEHDDLMKFFEKYLSYDAPTGGVYNLIPDEPPKK